MSYIPRTMEPQPLPAQHIHVDKVVAIDLCVMLNGPHVGYMLPFFLDSLRKQSSMEGVTLHFVHRDLTAPVQDYLKGIECESFQVHHHPESYKDFSVSHALREHGQEHSATDCAGMCEWMIENCGTTEWCFISHFDVEFLKDLLGWYRKLASQSSDAVGQVGSHRTGIVGYRRIALRQCTCGFKHFSGFFLAKDERNIYVIRHGSDKRLSDRSLPIHGFDVAELVEINLAGKGWVIESPAELVLNQWRNHLGSGSGHTGNNTHLRQRAMDVLNRRGLKPIA